MPYSSDNFDLSVWKLTLPVSEADYFGNGDSSAAEILPLGDNPEGITSLDGGFCDDKYFYISDDGALVFRTPLTGGTTTSNSKYVRSELRELYDWQPGESTGSANWENEGQHRLHAKLRVDEFFADDPQTVVGQIHTKYSSKPLVKLLWDGVDKPVRAILNEDPDNGNPFSLKFDTVGLEAFTYDIQLNGNTLTITVNTTTHQLTFGEGRLSEKWDDHVFYFKAGNYAQADKNSGGVFEVHFYELAIEHGNSDVLFVAGSSTLGKADKILVDRLDSLGYSVTVADDHDISLDDAADKELVLISKSVSSAVVGEKFTTVDVPVITWKSNLYDDLGLTGVQQDSDYGNFANQTEIGILEPTHPLAANLSGTVEIYSDAKKVAWGLPGEEAIHVASVLGNVNRSTIFAYESDALLANGDPTPAKRVGLFLGNTSSVTSNALNLFEAAVNWAIA